MMTSSRSPSPLAAAAGPDSSTGSSRVSAKQESLASSSHKTSPSAGHTSRTAQPANNTDVTSQNIQPNANATTTPRWTTVSTAQTTNAGDRQQSSNSSQQRIVQIPRGAGGPGTFSSGSLSLSTSRSPSTAASPRSSRDSSPAGRIFRQQSVPGAGGSSGMRKSQDVSPHRPPSITGYERSVPSAAAIQRALSAATTPSLPPTSAPTTGETTSRVPRPAKTGSSSATPSESSTPSWPISPRLKSPPPSGSRRNSLNTQKRAPNIVIQGATPTSSTDALPLIDQQLEEQESNIRQPSQLSKTSTREPRIASGAPTLETVQETSGPNTPGNDLISLSSNDPNQKYFDMPQSQSQSHLQEEKVTPGSTTPRRSMAPPTSRSMKASNSDSDGAEKKDESKKAAPEDPDTTPRPKAPSTRASYSSLRQAKTGGGMTVETETVNSVAQNSIGAPSDRVSSRTDGGTLRQKASNDTIKPSKSRKKASRKAPSITATGGMYDQHLFSPPHSPPKITSPRLRRREKHFLLSGADTTRRPRSSQSAINMYNNFLGSDVGKDVTMYARSEKDATSHSVEPAQESRFHTIRRRSSQLIATIVRATSPIKTDFRHREGSTRADIFEDRVKSQMDEETSDDSDETFVYESNPAEPPIRRSRHHSRTPSGASLTSMGGHQRERQGQGLLNTTKTRSMKFASANYNSADDEGLEGRDGAGRGGNASNRGSAVHHHHTGRPSRSTTGHTSILDDDGPFPQLNKVRSLTGLPGRQTQNARIAARNLQASNGNGNGKSHNDYMSSYDLSAEADIDETTPMLNTNVANTNMGTIRTPRSIRRPPTRSSNAARYPRRRQTGALLTRFAGCVAIIAMLFLLVFGIVGFLFIITTPLRDVVIFKLSGIVAAEEELMMDIKVGAVNPNLLPIQVVECDFNVFAKSQFVGSEKWWRDHPNGDWSDEPLPPKKLAIDGEDSWVPKIPGTWPGDDDDDDPEAKQTMLLGRIFSLDAPLIFEPSFLKRHNHNSTSSIRVSKPGNHTEVGGTERWERVILHEFDLIVRGTLKYTIPLGGRAYATNVGARVTVDPSKDKDGDPDDDEGKDPDDPSKPKKPEKGESGDSLVTMEKPRRLKFTVHPLEDEEDSIRKRLERRVFARILRTL